MSTKSETKRGLSDVINAASATQANQPEKKAKGKGTQLRMDMFFANTSGAESTESSIWSDQADVTNDATPVAKKKPQKKTNRKKSREKQNWRTNYEFFSDFSACMQKQQYINDDHALYKTVFDHIYKTSGEEALKALIKPYEKKIKKASDKNERMIGQWKLNVGGIIKIYRLDQVSFSNSEVRVDQFQMKPNCATYSNILEYSGESQRLFDHRNAYNAEMTVEYNARKDTIKGEVEVFPHKFTRFNDDKVVDGALIEFTGTRASLYDEVETDSDDDY